MRRVRIITIAMWSALVVTTAVQAVEPPTVDDAAFEKLHSLIKRQPGESRWMEIDWYPSVWEARQKAAATGKPIFLMAGSGGAPAAGC